MQPPSLSLKSTSGQREDSRGLSRLEMRISIGALLNSDESDRNTAKAVVCQIEQRRNSQPNLRRVRSPILHRQSEYHFLPPQSTSNGRRRVNSMQLSPLNRPHNRRIQTDREQDSTAYMDCAEAQQTLPALSRSFEVYQALSLSVLAEQERIPMSQPRTMASPENNRRTSRPTYTEEEKLFVWYLRTDLALSWDEVYSAYKRAGFPSRRKNGLICRFYRTLTDWNVENVRQQNRQGKAESTSHNTVGEYGVVQRTSRRYPWMTPEHQRAPMLPQFTREQSPTALSASSSSSNDPC